MIKRLITKVQVVWLRRKERRLYKKVIAQNARLKELVRENNRLAFQKHVLKRLDYFKDLRVRFAGKTEHQIWFRIENIPEDYLSRFKVWDKAYRIGKWYYEHRDQYTFGKRMIYVNTNQFALPFLRDDTIIRIKADLKSIARAKEKVANGETVSYITAYAEIY